MAWLQGFRDLDIEKVEARFDPQARTPDSQACLGIKPGETINVKKLKRNGRDQHFLSTKLMIFYR